jgi:hypothetical protein
MMETLIKEVIKLNLFNYSDPNNLSKSCFFNLDASELEQRFFSTTILLSLFNCSFLKSKVSVCDSSKLILIFFKSEEDIIFVSSVVSSYSILNFSSLCVCSSY